jgi:Uncharacterised nucleotidyltransferase
MAYSGQGGTVGPTPRSVAIAHTLVVDATTAEVVSALSSAGIRAVVLKGPSVANWLYDKDELRSYGDSDLLVRTSDAPCAEAVLAGLGFALQLSELDSDIILVPWARPWRRGRSVVDLHTSYYGIGVDPDVAWSALTATTEATTVAHTRVEVLAPPARALLVALHAAYHGGRAARAVQDLARAVRLLPAGLWVEAAALADRLHAAEGLVAGLTLLPPGEELVRGLGLEERLSQDSTLRRTDVGEGFARLGEAPGLAQKARILVRELFPSPAFLRWQTSLARRGRRGLLGAYVWRWWWLASKAPASYLAYRRTRRGR